MKYNKGDLVYINGETDSIPLAWVSKHWAGSLCKVIKKTGKNKNERYLLSLVEETKNDNRNPGPIGSYAWLPDELTPFNEYSIDAMEIFDV